ncbi:hypothetical protein BP5796_11216 [Coleophoma crateriformis]|uniref:Uncharacterized protein n=1 Tax=Coleophoma crateriformis TaxID=565419 RepID=A0A3D8QIR2_9HELO|nr:hypothetical protein BP5796_11216 [Coleophoma crateriformis]
MFSISPRPGATLFACIVFSTFLSGIAAQEKLPTFGDKIDVLGAMGRTDQDFADGLALDLFSPKNRTLVVKQNTAPLPAQFVSGTTGSPFVALMNYSYIITMNETANDLIAKIEIPFDLGNLAAQGVNPSNTYVGTLAADKQSWVVNDANRNVHISENNTRIIKMTSLDGEFMLLGRTTVDTTNVFVQYGQGETRVVNMTGGPGIQEAEFVDGLRFSTQAEKPLRMNVDIVNGINPATMPANTQSLNSFAWVVNTSDPNVRVNSRVNVPFNRAMLAALKSNGTSPSQSLMVARRALNATTEKFTPIPRAQQTVNEQPEDRIAIQGLTQLDGQYIIMVV